MAGDRLQVGGGNVRVESSAGQRCRECRAVLRCAADKGKRAAGSIEVQHAVVGDHELVAAPIAVAIGNSLNYFNRFCTRCGPPVNGLADGHAQGLAAVVHGVAVFVLPAVFLAFDHIPGGLAVAEPGHTKGDRVAVFGVKAGQARVNGVAVFVLAHILVEMLKVAPNGHCGGIVLRQADRLPGHERDIVGALDVDRHRLFHGAALAVRHPDGELVGRLVRIRQGIGRRVERKAVGVGDAAVIIGCGRKHQVAVLGVVHQRAVRLGFQRSAFSTQQQADGLRIARIHIRDRKAAVGAFYALCGMVVSIGPVVVAPARFRKIQNPRTRRADDGRVVLALHPKCGLKFQMLAVAGIGRVVHNNTEDNFVPLAGFRGLQGLHGGQAVVLHKLVCAGLGIEVERAVVRSGGKPTAVRAVRGRGCGIMHPLEDSVRFLAVGVDSGVGITEVFDGEGHALTFGVSHGKGAADGACGVFRKRAKIARVGV